MDTQCYSGTQAQLTWNHLSSAKGYSSFNLKTHFVFYGITANLHNFSDTSYQPKTTNPKQWQNIVKKEQEKKKQIIMKTG